MPLSKATMSRWLRVATPENTKALAKAAKTSVEHLKHIARGRRGVSAELAQRLAAASRTLRHRALYLDQRELCEVCGACPLVPHGISTLAKSKSPAKVK